MSAQLNLETMDFDDLKWSAFNDNYETKSNQKKALSALTHSTFIIINSLFPFVIKEESLGYYTNIFITYDLEMYITLTKEGKQFLQDKINDGKNIDGDHFLYDLLEDHLCTDFELIPSEYCGLTSCNLILTHNAWGLEFSHPRNYEYNYSEEIVGMDENSCYTKTMVSGDYIWHDPNYQVRSQVEDLFNDGIIELALHEF